MTCQVPHCTPQAGCLETYLNFGLSILLTSFPKPPECCPTKEYAKKGAYRDPRSVPCHRGVVRGGVGSQSVRMDQARAVNQLVGRAFLNENRLGPHAIPVLSVDLLCQDSSRERRVEGPLVRIMQPRWPFVHGGLTSQ